MERIVDKIKIIDGNYTNEDADYNVIRYALRHSNESPIGGTAVYPIDVEQANTQFNNIKKRFGKLDGRKIFHLCLSYPDNTSETKTKALADAKKLSESIGSHFQNVYGLHEDTDNIHVHFAINSVDYTNGRKITSEIITELSDNF